VRIQQLPFIWSPHPTHAVEHESIFLFYCVLIRKDITKTIFKNKKQSILQILFRPQLRIAHLFLKQRRQANQTHKGVKMTIKMTMSMPREKRTPRLPLTASLVMVTMAMAIGDTSAALRAATRSLQEVQTEHAGPLPVFKEQMEKVAATKGESAVDEVIDMHPEDWGTRGSDLVNVMGNVADLWEPYDSTRDTPFFWMIPKSGTTTLGSYMANCLDLVQANRVGSLYLGDTLEVVEHRGNRYANVDVTSHEGLEHARRMGLAESAMADVIIAGSVVHLSSIFNTHNKARMFTLMRNPIERVTSSFYYIQVATWERQYKPFLKDWTILQYINSEHHVDNSMVRTLVGKRSSKLTLSSKDLTNAKEIMARKCLVGLTSNYQETVQRFKKFFDWQEKDEHCLENLFAPGGGGNANSNKHRAIDKNSEEYDALREMEIWDWRLYNYAVELFEEQAKYFS
jgi:hypothetical protein